MPEMTTQTYSEWLSSLGQPGYSDLFAAYVYKYMRDNGYGRSGVHYAITHVFNNRDRYHW